MLKIMTKEAYCSEKISKLLKEKGFDEPCIYYYKDGVLMFTPFLKGRNSSQTNTCSAPTHQMACAWIREKGYHIYTFKGVDSWVYEVQSLNENWTFSLRGFSSHDEAIEAAIKYALENLI